MVDRRLRAHTSLKLKQMMDPLKPWLNDQTYSFTMLLEDCLATSLNAAFTLNSFLSLNSSNNFPSFHFCT